MPDDDLADVIATIGMLPPEVQYEALQAFARVYFGATIPGSGSYQRTTREEAPGAAFADRDFGDWAGKVRFEPGAASHHAPRKNLNGPVRRKALALKRMIASSQYEGERANAQASLDCMMSKWGFTERDL